MENNEPKPGDIFYHKLDGRKLIFLNIHGIYSRNEAEYGYLGPDGEYRVSIFKQFEVTPLENFAFHSNLMREK